MKNLSVREKLRTRIVNALTNVPRIEKEEHWLASSNFSRNRFVQEKCKQLFEAIRGHNMHAFLKNEEGTVLEVAPYVVPTYPAGAHIIDDSFAVFYCSDGKAFRVGEKDDGTYSFAINDSKNYFGAKSLYAGQIPYEYVQRIISETETIDNYKPLPDQLKAFQEHYVHSFKSETFPALHKDSPFGKKR